MATDRCVPLPTVTALAKMPTTYDTPAHHRRQPRSLVANLYGFFEPLGYVLDDARDGATGLRMATQHDYDAILLDLMLPRLDGMALCRKLREEYQNPVPVLMLTARDPVDDRVQGLAAGADDYLVKPFSLRELDARIQALVRRAQGRQVQGMLAWEDLQVDTRAPRAWRQGRTLHLTPTTHQLMMCLVRAAPVVVRRKEMEYLLWGRSRPRAGPCARTSMTCASRLTKTSRTRS